MKKSKAGLLISSLKSGDCLLVKFFDLSETVKSTIAECNSAF
jgi:hypothetical protein